ncbi:Immune-associated nucleotide-binding protein, partial [Thalictrum thalictroides]
FRVAQTSSIDRYPRINTTFHYTFLFFWYQTLSLFISTLNFAISTTNLTFKMGGSGIDEDWDLAETSSNEARTVVLVGRTGNGKSATGNSILGRKAFKSSSRSSGVTTTCEMQRGVLKNGQVVNVIDTPGLFDYIVGSAEEIVNCVRLAKDGIHAVLVVLSVMTRFSREEETAIRYLQTFFGDKFVDYMVVVFTGGDILEEDEETIEDYMGRDCPEPLKDILRMCNNRLVLFDNKTKDESKKTEQFEQLLALVNMVVAENGGQPFSDELLVEMKEREKQFDDQNKQVELLEDCSKLEISQIKKAIQKADEEQLKRLIEMVEQRLGETTKLFQQQLAEEQAARLKAETFAKENIVELQQLRERMEKSKETEEENRVELQRLRESMEKAKKQSDEETRVKLRGLTESLEKSRKETEELRRLAESGRCNIL